MREKMRKNLIYSGSENIFKAVSFVRFNVIPEHSLRPRIRPHLHSQVGVPSHQPSCRVKPRASFVMGKFEC